MLLEIPIKLESYVNEIKRQTKFINDDSKISLIQMGKTNVDDKTKYLLLMYNPFPSSIKIDCDFFTAESKVCKMYPGEFYLHGQSAYAFVVYVSGENTVEIDEDKILGNLRSSISSRLSKLIENDEEQGYEPHNIYKIEANQIDIENTINLESYLEDIKNPIFVKYSQKHINVVDVYLTEIIPEDGYVKIGVKFTNNSDNVDLELNGYRLKIFDSMKIMHIEIKQVIKLKHKTSKITYIHLNKIEFEQIENKDMQFKIVII
jgi:hypothetical protein